MSTFTIVVAIDSHRGIGLHNTLPWHLPPDLAHFKRITSGHTIIMGRKTFDSIGRPLPNRRSIVISRDPHWQHDGVEAVTSINAALQLAGAEEAFIIGGAQIFAETLLLADRLIVTEIDKNFGCDVFFPPISQEKWEEVAREQHHYAQDALDYAFVTYQKR